MGARRGPSARGVEHGSAPAGHGWPPPRLPRHPRGGRLHRGARALPRPVVTAPHGSGANPPNLDLELPERGTGVRAARRAAAAATDPVALRATPAAPEPPTAREPSRRWMLTFSAALVA